MKLASQLSSLGARTGAPAPQLGARPQIRRAAAGARPGSALGAQQQRGDGRRASPGKGALSCAAQRDEASGEEAGLPNAAYLAALGLMMPFLLSDGSASAAGNPLLTGKTVSLIHPAIMLFLFGATGYTGWLGLQWRQARTIPAQVKELKAQLPKPDADGNRVSSPLEGEISALEMKRKDIMKADPREKHNNWGSLLLGLGVLIAIEGPVNTYLRAGKLFPGPHLYAGAAIVVLWAGAAALVPAMKRGNDVARTLHITLNSLNLLLFAWQVPTGFDIVQKVWANVAWP